MQSREIFAIVEAVLFVAGDAVLVQDLAQALDIDCDRMHAELEKMQENYEKEARGLCLKKFGEHVQLSTRAEMAQYVEKLLQPVQKQSLSQAALETLAIIAYRQPVTKMEIEGIRGVKCDYSVQSLLNKQLICDAGRKEVVGRPILYCTTDTFLAHFGLKNLEELPKQMQERENLEAIIP